MERFTFILKSKDLYFHEIFQRLESSKEYGIAHIKNEIHYQKASRNGQASKELLCPNATWIQITVCTYK